MSGTADVILPRAEAVPRDAMADPPARPVAAPAGRSWVRTAAWPVVRPLLWAGVPAAVSAALVLFAVKPTQPAPADKGVAAAWGESIGRLGVWPVYPPEEDIYVGDLWAVLLAGDPGDDGPGPGAADRAPILVTSARIGHINLADLLRDDEARRVRFSGEEARPGDSARAGGGAPDGVRLSLVAFPGVTISHDREVGTSFGSGWFGWGATNRAVSSDEIHLTDTYTYGVPLGEASGTMQIWCAAEGAAVCSDAYARRVLYQTGITGTLDRKPDGKSYMYGIELRLVSRVFLARTIDQRSSAGSDRGLGARTSLDGKPAAPTDQQGAPPAPGAGAQALAAQGQAMAAEANGTGNGASVVAMRSDGSSVELKTTYGRPIVFGYRAASMLLPPVVPGEGSAP